MRFQVGVTTLCAVLALAVLPAATQAQQFGIDSFTGMVFADENRDRSNSYTNTGTPGGRITDAYPDPSTGGTGIYELAGGHPYIGVTDFDFNRVSPTGPPAGGNVDNLRVDIPRGLMPNPRAFDRCTEAELNAHNCPISSQIGTEELKLYIQALAPLTGDITLRIPLYNMTPLSNPENGPQEDVVARFAFDPAEAGEALAGIPTLSALAAALLDLHPVHIVGGVRDEPNPFGPFDYGLYFTIEHLPAYDPSSPTSPGVLSTDLTFWGAPGDPAHNPQRGVSCVGLPTLSLNPCTALPPPGSAPDPALPFLSNPTECTNSALVGRLTVWSAGNALSDTSTDQTPVIQDRDDGTFKSGAQECQQLTLAPAIDLVPDIPQPDTPTGPEVTLSMANEGLLDRSKFAESHAKDITVTLPPGMTINPSAANGLEACTDAQFAANVGQPAGEACPAASRIGDVRTVSPLLPPAASDPPSSTPVLNGSAYVGQPLAGDRYRLFVTIEGRKVSVRLKGSVKPNPGTGQLTAVFQDNPQLPVETLTVDFRDGPRAPLATPQDCGPKTAAISVTPWSGTAPVGAASDPFDIAGDGCQVGFQPSFAAAPASSAGGAFTPFTVRIGRDDRNQFLSGVRVDTPPGLAAKIKGVTKCAGAAANAGACPAASRIGTATTTAGAGSEPYRLSGPVYFTEGYKGAPYGMVAVIRAIAGPYDLGTVVVRQAIHVDPNDASLTVLSDPLPQILEGVPIRLRTVDVALDKPGFTYNPTSCGSKSVGGRLHSIQGTAADRGASFQVDGCERLGFTPRMRLQLIGPKQMGQGKHPGLLSTVIQPAREANIAGAVVKLPKSLALDPRNSRVVCGYEAGLRADCPKRTRVGTATAVSPVLDEKLTGPVYLVQGIRFSSTGNRIRTLPSLLAKLNGEIRINVRGTTDVEGGKLVSTFAAIPDAPVSRFDLRIAGGRKGILAATGRPALCGRRQVSVSRLSGHNGKVAAQRRVAMVKPCARPRLKIKRLRARGSSLLVGGTIARAARGRIAVSARCGKTRVAKRAKRPRKGRWAATLKLRGACADASRAKVRIAYAGGGAYKATARKRNVNLPGGS